MNKPLITIICILLSISMFVLVACSDNVANSASLEGTATPTIYFPQAGANKKSSLEASKTGVLTTNGSCLYVGGTLVMWPSSYRMTIENGLVNVKTRFGKVVAIENEKVSMGGGAVPYHFINNPELTSIFDECPGTGQVWSVSEAELAP